MNVELKADRALKYVGFLAEVKMDKNPIMTLSQSQLFRVILIDKVLRKYGAQIFLYSPAMLQKNKTQVDGYIIKEKEFVSASLPVPNVNGNWSYRSVTLLNQGMGYREFLKWSKRNSIDVYDVYEFSEFASNKFETYRAISNYKTNLHPITEVYSNKVDQLERFFDKADKVFLKPRNGNKGNNIIVVEQQKEFFKSILYLNKNRTEMRPKNLLALRDYLGSVVGDENYIIQQGIRCANFYDAAFDVRIIAVNDGSQWVCMHEVRVGSKNSDLSNNFQGGYSITFEEFLEHSYDTNGALAITKKLNDEAIQLSKYLNALFEGLLVEIAYDFLLDEDDNVFIAEINTKPGLLGDRQYKNLFEISSEEKEDFQKFILPYCSLLGSFFAEKLNVFNVNNSVWFGDIKNNEGFTPYEMEELSRWTFKKIKLGEGEEFNMPIFAVRDAAVRIVLLSISDGRSIAETVIGSGVGIKYALQNALKKISLIYKKTFSLKWLRLDVVDNVFFSHDFDVKQPVPYERNIYGLAFSKESQVAFLPDQLLAQTFLNNEQYLRLDNIRKYLINYPLKKYMFRSEIKNDKTNLYHFTVKSVFVDDYNSIELFQGARVFQKITSDDLFTSAKMAGNYLINESRDDGSFNYRYLPKIDSDSERFSIAGQSGSVYAALKLYEVTNNINLLDVAKKGLDFLIEKMEVDYSLDNPQRYIVDGEYVTLDSNAITLLAFMQYMKVSGDLSYKKIVVEMLSWVSHLSDYSAIAVYAMIKGYQLFDNMEWKNAAIKGVNYLIDMGGFEFDHLLMCALYELYMIEESSVYVDYVYDFCKSILISNKIASEKRSYFLGALIEGLCSAYKLLIHVDKKSKLTADILKLVEKKTKVLLRNQYTPESLMFIANPQKAMGGVKKSEMVYEVRTEYVQAFISALLEFNSILHIRDDLASI